MSTIASQKILPPEAAVPAAVLRWFPDAVLIGSRRVGVATSGSDYDCFVPRPCIELSDAMRAAGWAPIIQQEAPVAPWHEAAVPGAPTNPLVANAGAGLPPPPAQSVEVATPEGEGRVTVTVRWRPPASATEGDGAHVECDVTCDPLVYAYTSTMIEACSPCPDVLRLALFYARSGIKRYVYEAEPNARRTKHLSMVARDAVDAAFIAAAHGGFGGVPVPSVLALFDGDASAAALAIAKVAVDAAAERLIAAAMKTVIREAAAAEPNCPRPPLGKITAQLWLRLGEVNRVSIHPLRLAWLHIVAFSAILQKQLQALTSTALPGDVAAAVHRAATVITHRPPLAADTTGMYPQAEEADAEAADDGEPMMRERSTGPAVPEGTGPYAARLTPAQQQRVLFCLEKQDQLLFGIATPAPVSSEDPEGANGSMLGNQRYDLIPTSEVGQAHIAELRAAFAAACADCEVGLIAL